jgi:hypothetical protein
MLIRELRGAAYQNNLQLEIASFSFIFDLLMMTSVVQNAEFRTIVSEIEGCGEET